jgi:hypothetical protein
MLMRWSLRKVLGCALLGAALAGCADDGAAPSAGYGDAAAPLVLKVATSEAAGVGLTQAAVELEALAREISGAPDGMAETVTVTVTLGDEAAGAEGYSLSTTEAGVSLEAGTELGAMYGLYQLASDLGVLYIHPEETVTPADPDVALPAYDGSRVTPSFALRGFHEHTQHPIVMSDYVLRPDVPGFRDAVSRYIRWLARNRQNYFSVHLLNTVDLDAWIPWMAEIVSEAHDFGVQVGVMASFADQQQHNFKLIDATSEVPTAQQIRGGLDRLLATGIDHIVWQIGTSEFTRPGSEEVLGWIDVGVDHVTFEHPSVTPWAWIHITCDLETEEGEPFFHLPLNADPTLGAFVHTTMFYTVTDPAPVYECETFSHQLDFLEAAKGERQQVFFPETAWWLGFDDNLPLLMPVTGWSREQDIARMRRDYDVMGHVTFTTGREWTYWHYDHYLSVATWDASLTWSAYLDRLTPLYGASAVEALKQWTARQAQDFYVTNPEIYFYLAGELPQDELGAQIGIVARRPKRAFKEIVALGASEFATWKSADYDLLIEMEGVFAGLLAKIPTGDTHLTRELRRTAELYVERLRHTVALYGGAIAIRDGDRDAAESLLAVARAITVDVLEAVQEAEDDVYRHPIDLLAREKPESLTAYPFGYLWQTSTAFFWARRDDQLDSLITATFDANVEAWGSPPLAVYLVPAELVTLIEPDDPLAAGLLTGFLPNFLIAIRAWDPATGALGLSVSQDHDVTGLPDPGTEALWAGTVTESAWQATRESYAVTIRDVSAEALGDLTLLNPTLEATPDLSGDVPAMDTIDLVSEFDSAEAIELVRSVAGIDREGLGNLLKGAFGLPESEPLPERLGVRFRLVLEGE